MEPDGKLDEREVELVNRWIATHWRHGPCPVCEANTWAPNLRIGEIVNEATAFTGESFPLLLIFCTICGYTLPINARIAGIKTLPEDDDAVAVEPANTPDSELA